MTSVRLVARAAKSFCKALVPALLVVAAVPLFTTAHAFNSGDIVVDSAKGEARLTQGGREREVRRGQIVLVPSTLRTGRDGAVDLRQGATLVNVGPETVLEFPAAQERGEPVERIVQSRGSAFYDVGKRDARKLRVETPYLVAVIKGTQFSVSVQADSTSISLVEGSLEISDPEGGAVVDLAAGEIATRRQGEAGITVVDITTAQVRGTGAGAADAAASVAGQRAAPDAVAGIAIDAPRLPVGVEVAADVAAGRAAVVDLSTAVDAGAARVAVDTGATVGLGAGAVAVETDISLGAGPAGAVVDLGTGAAVEAGAVNVEVGAGLSADLGGAGGTPLAVELDVGAGVAGVDVAVGAAVDAGAGTIGLGVDLGIVDLDVGLDLGLDNDTTGDVAAEDAGTDTQGGGIIENVGGLLDGLLRRPGRP